MKCTYCIGTDMQHDAGTPCPFLQQEEQRERERAEERAAEQRYWEEGGEA